MHPDRRGVLIGGHLRLKVWVAMGNTSVPVVQVSLDEAGERELNLRLNRGGAFDMKKVADLLPIDALYDIGFQETDFAGMLDTMKEPAPVIREVQLRPFNRPHFLISVTPEQLGSIADHLDAIKSTGVDFYQASN